MACARQTQVHNTHWLKGLPRLSTQAMRGCSGVAVQVALALRDGVIHFTHQEASG